MTKTIEELIKKAKDNNIDINYCPKSKQEVIDALAKHYSNTNRPGKAAPLEQVQPMLARDIFDLSQEEQKIILEDDNDWLAEEKLDGIRAIMHIGETGNRFTTRERSVKTFSFREITDNLPHLNTLQLSDWNGTIIDGEAILETQVIDTGATKAYGTLSATSAVCNCSPEKAKALQGKYGYITYHVFDIIKYKGVSLLNRVFYERRKILVEMLDEMIKAGIELNNIKLVPQVFKDKFKYYNRIVRTGGEGIMLKNQIGMYRIIGRSRSVYKMKKHLTVDGVISGYGKKDFKGLIGSLLISVKDEEGVVREIAGVSPNVLDIESEENGFMLRKEMTEIVDGKPTLKKEYYGRVVELLAFDWNKNLRLYYARILRWRNDKTQDECTIDLSQVKLRFKDMEIRKERVKARMQNIAMRIGAIT